MMNEVTKILINETNKEIKAIFYRHKNFDFYEKIARLGANFLTTITPVAQSADFDTFKIVMTDWELDIARLQNEYAAKVVSKDKYKMLMHTCTILSEAGYGEYIWDNFCIQYPLFAEVSEVKNFENIAKNIYNQAVDKKIEDSDIGKIFASMFR